ncbi:MAG: winged helix DNA-binding domain-containing protein [Bacteroidales bacterium]|nr:winged helix DNA-binding domain-containing protein [Bacteroidales bacterium]
MTLPDISIAREISQQIVETRFNTPNEIVTWMGAMQAQDFPMVKWAVSLRLPGSSEASIEAAMDKGEILRTHLLRPTWHLVAADDIHWMLGLTANRIKASMKSRDKELELDETIYSKCNALIQKALSGCKQFTRDEIIAEIKIAGIATDNNRASHILMRAELDGIVCSGALKGNKQTYALLDERVPKTAIISREESLGKLASRYFISHGPASLNDFVWWSGLAVSDARIALEMVKTDLISEIIGNETYWFRPTLKPINPDLNKVILLPAFDEFIISYKDRSASLLLNDHKKAVSDNGIFRPVIMINGLVTGIWKRRFLKEKVIIETDFLRQHTSSEKKQIEIEAAKYGLFLNKKAEVIFKNNADGK